MKGWNEWSDFEINKVIAEWVGFGYFGFYKQSGSGVRCNTCGGETVILDYCNSWADAGPIIESIWDYLFSEDEFGVPIWDQIKHSFSINATRAVAIAFLMKNGVTPNEIRRP